MIKRFFLLLIFIHALLHLIGFLRGIGVLSLQDGKCTYNSLSFFLWLTVAVLFLISGLLYLNKYNSFYYLMIISLVLSQILIISFWNDAKYGTIINVFLVLIMMVGYAEHKFDNKFLNILSASLENEKGYQRSILKDSDISELPEPVRKYLYYTRSVGKERIGNFKVKFTGKLRSAEEDKWMSFSSEQFNFVSSVKRFFKLKARMNGMPVYGQHIFMDGSAKMDIRLFGLIKVQYEEGFEMNVSETVTFFNDMCVLAPGSLIDERIIWNEIENNKVKADFTANGITISALLVFEDDGRLVNFISDDRYARQKNGTMIKAKWMTPIETYYDFNGYYLPGIAETTNIYSGKEFCYGQFRTVEVKYNFY